MELGLLLLLFSPKTYTRYIVVEVCIKNSALIAYIYIYIYIDLSLQINKYTTRKELEIVSGIIYTCDYVGLSKTVIASISSVN